MKRFAHRDALLVLMFAVLSVVLWCMPTPFDQRVDASAVRCRGHVLQADNAGLQKHAILTVGSQTLIVRVLDGPFAQQQFTVDNQLLGRMDVDKLFAVGDEALLVITRKTDGTPLTVTVQDHYRIGGELALLAAFAALLLAFGGWTGAKALLSFIFTGLVLWKIFVPSLLQGMAPVPLAFAIVALLTACIIFLVAGLNRLGATAFAGAMLGVGTSSLLCLWAVDALHVNGAIMPFAETMLYSGYAHLDITGIYVAAVFVAASGAVMDLAMDVAASQREIVRNSPGITRCAALVSGLRVGRAVVGTMTTTLLLAYSGGYLTLLMAFMAQGVPLLNLFNLLYVAAEVTKTLAGSLGLVLVAPFTAMVGAVLFVPAQRKETYATVSYAPGPDIVTEPS